MPVTLTLGGTDNALVYARDSARPLVFTVAPALETRWWKPASEFRRKDVFDFRSFTLTRLEVVRGADTLVAVKSKGADGKDVWKNGAGKALDTMKVEDMPTTLSSLRAGSFDAGDARVAEGAGPDGDRNVRGGHREGRRRAGRHGCHGRPC